MSSTASAKLESYVMLSPDGKHLEVTKQLFDAIQEYGSNQQSGSITVHFRTGRIIEVHGNKVFR